MITGDGEVLEMDSELLADMDSAQDEYERQLDAVFEEEQEDWVFVDGE